MSNRTGTKKTKKESGLQQIQLPEYMITWRVDRALSRLFPDWSRAGIGELIRDEGVYVNDLVMKKGSTKIKRGDSIFVDSGKIEAVKKRRNFAEQIQDFAHTGEVSAVVPEDIDLDIVFEDKSLLVVDKPVGMVIHPAYANPTGTLANAVAGYFQKKGIAPVRRIGLVNRLDKDVAGLVMIAKNDEALRILSKQFSSDDISPRLWNLSRKAHKYYWAVVGPATDENLRKIGIGVGRKKKIVEGYIRRSLSDRKYL